jgi:hypothetical protein
MLFCRVKDFLVHRRSVDPAQAWTDSIRRSLRWHVLPRLFKAEIGHLGPRAMSALALVSGHKRQLRIIEYTPYY